MFANASIYTLLPFIMALALTHLLVLPIKSFFLKGWQQGLAQRTTIANVVVTVYAILAFYILGSNNPGTVWATVKLIPVVVTASYSIGVWIYLMFRGPKQVLILDVSVFTIIALFAS